MNHYSILESPAGDHMSEDPQEARKDGVRAVERSLEIVLCVGMKGGERGISLMEISKETGIHKSTTFRLVFTLTRRRFLQQDPETERYRLGTAILELAGLYLADIEIRREAAPYLIELMNSVCETVHLGIVDDGEVVYIDKYEYPSDIRLYSRLGTRAPMHSTSLGKAILAQSFEDDVTMILSRGMLARTPNTITTTEDLRKELIQIRARGYAVDNEENRLGIRCVAAPIFDYRGRPVAAVSISGLTSRVTNERLPEIGQQVKITAEHVSKRMGYRH